MESGYYERLAWLARDGSEPELKLCNALDSSENWRKRPFDGASRRDKDEAHRSHS